MARQLRIQFGGALYHVMARGNARQDIFRSDDDRRLFLEELWKTCDHRDWLVWAYCLMSNHYHVLIETLAPTLAVGMHDLNGTYAIEFNRRHDRVGHLFQGRYVARLVDARAYLLTVLRYIVLNPVEGGLCAAAADWRWSSYRDVAGMRAGASPRLAVHATLAQFSDDPQIARRAYEQFVAAGVGQLPPKPHPDNPLIIGDDAFVARVTSQAAAPSPEVPRPQRVNQPLEALHRRIADRNAAIREAFATGTYSQAALARYFEVHPATVCRVLARGPRLRGRDAAIQDVTPDDGGSSGQPRFTNAAIQDVTP